MMLRRACCGGTVGAEWLWHSYERLEGKAVMGVKFILKLCLEIFLKFSFRFRGVYLEE